MCQSQNKENNPRGTVQYLFGYLSMNGFECINPEVKVFIKNPSSIKYTHPLPSLMWPPSLACSEKVSQYTPFRSVPIPPVTQFTCYCDSSEENSECKPLDPGTPIHVQ